MRSIVTITRMTRHVRSVFITDEDEEDEDEDSVVVEEEREIR